MNAKNVPAVNAMLPVAARKGGLRSSPPAAARVAATEPLPVPAGLVSSSRSAAHASSSPPATVKIQKMACQSKFSCTTPPNHGADICDSAIAMVR